MISASPTAAPSAPSSAGSISSQSSWRKPQMIDSTDVMNNQIAQGFAAGAGAIKTGDRNGISRGKGHKAMAAVKQAQGIAEGQGAAAMTQVETDKANAGMRLDYEHGREMEAQRLAMVQHSLSQSDWSVAMAGQQAAAQVDKARKEAHLQILRSLYG
jgi:hypothetical protein